MRNVVMGLDGQGRITREYYPCMEAYPEFWTADMPGSMPGNSAVYVGSAQKDGEWYGGSWEFDPPTDDSLNKE